jgi:hypothetical protein
MDLKQLQSWLAHHRKAAYGVIFFCSAVLGGSAGILLAPLFGR